jgi:acyl carrier protein
MLRFFLMKEEEMLDLLCEAIELPKGALKGTEELRALQQWDSLTVMAVISLADERCGILLSPERITACKTVTEVLACMRDADGVDA